MDQNCSLNLLAIELASKAIPCMVCSYLILVFENNHEAIWYSIIADIDTFEITISGKNIYMRAHYFAKYPSSWLHDSVRCA